MLSQKLRDLLGRAENRVQKRVVLICSFALVLLGYLCVPTCAFAVQSAESRAEPNQLCTEAAGDASAQIEQVCFAIYKGDFAAARQILGKQDQFPNTAISQLAGVVSEYEAIEQSRRATKEAAYAEKLAELEKLQGGSNDVDDVNDANEVSGATKALVIIVGACEFADQRQKDQLLSEPFVKQTIQKAIDKAAKYESEGKWLDAYISCYNWLQAIDPDNEVYSNQADRLLEKANIAASLQDSPCESREQRFRGVKKQMFVRAISILNSSYVSIIDYRQMAAKAIKRCKLLAEVVAASPAVCDALGEKDAQYDIHNTQYDRKLAAWSAALGAILDEVNQSPTEMSKDKFIDIFEKTLALNTTTVELPQPVLIAQFAEAALSALDSYTAMIWPVQVEDFEKVMTNEFTGIGIEISKQKGLLTVVSLLPDTPAYNSGLDAQDVIEAVDGVPTKDMTIGCAVKRITGPEGTEVVLTIRHTGEEQSRDITITRAKITVPTIRGWQRTTPISYRESTGGKKHPGRPYKTSQNETPEAGKWLYMIDELNKIGYVRLTNFSERTASDLEKVLVRLEAKGLRGLILDLRFNTGGLLNSAVEVTDKFLEEGLIVVTRPRSWVSSTYAAAHKKHTHPNYPLVVLIDHGSASASEIVAGALADPQHNRAVLVGERTYGKGSVQGISHYPGEGAQLKFTTAYYHLPSGQRVESQDAMEKLDRRDWGVGPNIEVKLRSDELTKRFDVQRDNAVLVKADHDDKQSPLKKHTLEETLAADPQLAVGLLVVKTKLIEAENSSRMMTVRG